MGQRFGVGSTTAPRGNEAVTCATVGPRPSSGAAGARAAPAAATMSKPLTNSVKVGCENCRATRNCIVYPGGTPVRALASSAAIWSGPVATMVSFFRGRITAPWTSSALV